MVKLGRRWQRGLLLCGGGLLGMLVAVVLLGMLWGSSIPRQHDHTWSLDAHAQGTDDVRDAPSLSLNNNDHPVTIPAFSLSHLPDKKFFAANSINGELC